MNIILSELRGNFVYLDLVQPSHRELVRALAKDDRIWEFTKTLLVNDRFDENFDAYFNTALDPRALGGQQAFLIKQVSDDAVIGMTRLYNVEPKDKKLMIGYTWYSPLVWGKIHNKECKLLLLQYVFETMAFMRAEFQVAGQNIRSQKAVEKIGGFKEGILRKTGFRADGSIRDTVIFSIIDDEWPEKKEKLVELINKKS